MTRPLLLGTIARIGGAGPSARVASRGPFVLA